MSETENEHEAKMARPRMAAGALFFDEQGRVMLLEPTYKEYRDIPGGYVDAGESAVAGMCAGGPRGAGHHARDRSSAGRRLGPSPAEGDKVLYLFDGGALPAQLQERIRLQRSEVKAYAFHSLDDVDSMTIPRLARRVQAAVIARNEGQVAYLEHGQHPAW